ncbi:MAG: hypothetical protein AAFP81_16170 [Pseudomonadota bacterium]
MFCSKVSDSIREIERELASLEQQIGKHRSGDRLAPTALSIAMSRAAQSSNRLSDLVGIEYSEGHRVHDLKIIQNRLAQAKSAANSECDRARSSIQDQKENRIKSARTSAGASFVEWYFENWPVRTLTIMGVSFILFLILGNTMMASVIMAVGCGALGFFSARYVRTTIEEKVQSIEKKSLAQYNRVEKERQAKVAKAESESRASRMTADANYAETKKKLEKTVSDLSTRFFQLEAMVLDAISNWMAEAGNEAHPFSNSAKKTQSSATPPVLIRLGFLEPKVNSALPRPTVAIKPIRRQRKAVSKRLVIANPKTAAKPKTTVKPKAVAKPKNKPAISRRKTVTIEPSNTEMPKKKIVYAATIREDTNDQLVIRADKYDGYVSKSDPAAPGDPGSIDTSLVGQSIEVKFLTQDSDGQLRFLVVKKAV